MNESIVETRLLIIGHYGGANTGDEAMLLGLLRGVRAAGWPADIVVAAKESFAPEWVQEFGATVIPLAPVAIMRALAQTDLVVFGGGTNFHDDYRGRRYLRHLIAMGRLLGVFTLARLLGCKVAWLSVGLGPFFRSPTRWLARAASRTAQILVARDRNSEMLAGKWLPRRRVRYAFDLAGLVPLEPNSSEDSNLAGKRRVLGVSVKLVAETQSVGPEGDDFQSLLALTLQDLLREDPELEVKVFPFRGGEVESDIAPSRWLVAELEKVAPARVRLVPYRVDPRAMLNEIAGCTHFIATRYHAAVLAYLAGCRFVVVPYHLKVTEFLKVIGAGEDRIIPYDATGEELRRRLSRLLTEAASSPETSGKLTPAAAAGDAVRNIEFLAELLQISYALTPARELVRR